MPHKFSPQQTEIPDFYLPFGGKLDPLNRWVRLAQMVPWDLVDERYSIDGKGPPNPAGVGAPAIPSRIAFGALIIKERLGCSDGETVAQIVENPYLQFFLGYTEMLKDEPFDPSMMVHFRKRFNEADYNEINLTIIKADPELPHGNSESNSSESDHSGKEINSSPAPPETGADESSASANQSKEEKAAAPGDSDSVTHDGKLLIDASVTPADITYPTDLKLLNAARVMLELIIDILHSPFIGILPKPRTYRKIAKKEYLKVTKLKKAGRKKIRSAIRKQLGYIKRDLEHIDRLLDDCKADLSSLSRYQYRCLVIAHEIYRQQLEMWKTKTNRIDDRIVSLSQPWVRPIVRGKQSAKVEFGAKVSISVVAGGYVMLDRLNWEAYNESCDLIEQAEKYHANFGFWPESIHADKIYLTRANRKWCKDKGIRLSGPPLGRPVKKTEANAEQIKASKKQQEQDARDRNPVEGKFGNCKRKGTLNRVMAKLQDTSVSVINIGLIVLNLDKRLAKIASILLASLVYFWSNFCAWLRKKMRRDFANLHCSAQQ